MSLKEYARKRTFSRTPEPPPASKESSAPLGAAPGPKTQLLSFVVQRHHARRLHYDFRLELDGTLKSWAVPKGPTLDPSVKRLAVHVEDHPLDYGGFEGNIPAGQYGGGSVMVWDRGAYEVLGKDPPQAQYARGDFKFRLDGEKLRGEFALVRTKARTKGRGDNQWLLIKKKDAAAVPGWDPENHPLSALSGRSQEEIAKEAPPDKTAATKAQKAGKRSTAARSKPRIDPKDLPGAVRAGFPATVAPMLAVSANTPPEGSGKPGSDDWLYEIKWDGMRVILFLDQTREKEKIRLLTRRGNDCSRQFPELTVAHQSFAAEQAVQQAILDGEVVVLDDRGRPSFPLLQPRIMAADAGAIANLVRTHPVVYCVFDLLYLDGYDLRAVPLAERKRALETILISGPHPNSLVRFSEHIMSGSGSGGSGQSTGKDFLAAARAQELEGIMAKRAASRYESRRSPDWVKIKIASQQEFVICGFTEGSRDTFAALVLGVYEDGKLVTVGSVGTGFDEPMLRALAERLQLLVTSRSPFPAPIKLSKPASITWVRPELVCTVRFNSWTPDGRLRAPVFLGLRPDIDPAECTRGGAGEAASASESPTEPSSESAQRAASFPLAVQKVASGRNRKGTASAVPHERGNAGASEVSPSLATKHLADASSTVTVDIDGRQLKFTNLNKVFYPREGNTKRDVIRYYDAVAPLLLPYLKDRPLSLRRYPDGIEGESFFQKHARTDFPSWLRTETIEMHDGKKPTSFVVADDRASLLYLANLACIDQNPWMSRVLAGKEGAGKMDLLEHPDFILIDLDPQDCPYDRIVEAAQLIRQKLDLLELEGYPKTTGGHGMHIYVPVEPVYTYEQTRAFAEILARWVAEERPDLFTTPRPVARRDKGKVYFDYLQNAYGKTISAPYVLRAHPGAPVATPLAWHEVAPGLVPTRFHMRNALDRFASVGDLFRPVLDSPQRLEPALEQLAVVMKPQ